MPDMKSLSFAVQRLLFVKLDNRQTDGQTDRTKTVCCPIIQTRGLKLLCERYCICQLQITMIVQGLESKSNFFLCVTKKITLVQMIPN